MNRTIYTLYLFFIKPKYEVHTTFNAIQLIYTIFLFLSIRILLIALLYLFLSCTTFDIQNDSSFFDDFNYLLFLKVVIIGPVLEEFLFRSILRFGRFSFAAFLFALLYTTADFMEINSYIRIFIPLLFVYVFYVKNIRIPEGFYLKYYPVLLYSSAVLFAYVHLWTFNITFHVLLFSPLLLFPKFVSGMLFSFIRIRFGLLYSIITHSLNNLIAALIYIYVIK